MGYFEIKRWIIWPQMIREPRLGTYRKEQTGSEPLQTMQLGVGVRPYWFLEQQRRCQQHPD